MARVSNFDTGNATPEVFQRYTTKAMNDVSGILNKGILFADNFDAQIVDVTFSAANANTVVTHNLQRTPLGYIRLSSTAATIIYDGSAPSSINEITLRASAACTAKLLIF
jgi:hypothetical protein